MNRNYFLFFSFETFVGASIVEEKKEEDVTVVRKELSALCEQSRNVS